MQSADDRHNNYGNRSGERDTRSRSSRPSKSALRDYVGNYDTDYDGRRPKVPRDSFSDTSSNHSDRSDNSYSSYRSDASSSSRGDRGSWGGRGRGRGGNRGGRGGGNHGHGRPNDIHYYLEHLLMIENENGWIPAPAVVCEAYKVVWANKASVPYLEKRDRLCSIEPTDDPNVQLITSGGKKMRCCIIPLPPLLKK